MTANPLGLMPVEDHLRATALAVGLDPDLVVAKWRELQPNVPSSSPAGEALVQQIAKALELQAVEGVGWDDLARAVLPLVEAQVAPLRDERDRLKEQIWQQEDMLGHARIEVHKRLGELVLEKGAAESALRQVREDLTALAEEWDLTLTPPRLRYEVAAKQVRAILDSARVGAADAQPEGAGEVISTGHARAIVQMSEWMERAETAEAERDALRLALSNEPEPAPRLRAMVEHERETRPPTAGSNGDTAPEADDDQCECCWDGHDGDCKRASCVRPAPASGEGR